MFLKKKPTKTNPTFLNKLMHQTDGRKKKTQNKSQHNWSV